MSGLLADRVVLVSGGTSGVGAAVARAARREGATVAVAAPYRRAGCSVGRHGEKVAAELGALFVSCDVADVESCRAAVTTVVAEYGRVDGLVNAAGLTDRGSLLDTTPELFDAHVAVNLRGPFFLMQAVVADLVRRGEPGSIVTIGSEAARGGAPELAPYAAAKGGLATLTRNAAHAHRYDRIRINQLDIGWTASEGEDVLQRGLGAGEDWRARAGATLPAGRLATPEDAAEMVVLLLSDRSGVVTGSVIDWDQQVPGAHD